MKENDIPIEDCIYNDYLSMRSYNICRFNELMTIDQVISYYKEHGSFRELRSCGQKSDDELIELCKKYDTRKVQIETIEQQEDKYQVRTVLENNFREEIRFSYISGFGGVGRFCSFDFASVGI